MILQGVVDHSYRFSDINVGWPGRLHDARVFAHSSLYEKVVGGELLPRRNVSMNGVDVPLFLIGDSAYPLQSWRMKPFAHNSSLTLQQKTYNYRICKACIVDENAYGRLKARWRRLLKRNDMDISNIPTVIAAACILHNICEVHGETFNDSWIQDVDNFPQPPTSTLATRTEGRPKNIRDAWVHFFLYISITIEFGCDFTLPL